MRDNVATICDTQNEHTKITQQFVCENVSLVYWRDSVASEYSYECNNKQLLHTFSNIAIQP